MTKYARMDKLRKRLVGGATEEQQQAYEKAQKKITKAQNETRAAKTKMDGTKLALEKAQTELADLEKKLADIPKNINLLDQLLRKYTDDKTKTEAKLSKKVKDAETDLALVQTRTNQLKAEVATLKKTIADNQVIIDTGNTHKGTGATLDGTTDPTLTEYDTAKTNKTTAETKLKQTDKDLTKTYKELNAATNQVTVAKSKLEATEELNDDNIDDTEEKLETEKIEVYNLNLNIPKKQSEITKLKETLEKETVAWEDAVRRESELMGIPISVALPAPTISTIAPPPVPTTSAIPPQPIPTTSVITPPPMPTTTTPLGTTVQLPASTVIPSETDKEKKKRLTDELAKAETDLAEKKGSPEAEQIKEKIKELKKQLGIEEESAVKKAEEPTEKKKTSFGQIVIYILIVIGIIAAVLIGFWLICAAIAFLISLPAYGAGRIKGNDLFWNAILGPIYLFIRITGGPE